jgi:replicative DNA helicase
MAAEKSAGSRRGRKKQQAVQPQERRLPQSPEAEVALLGSIFFDPTVMGEVVEITRPSDFYVPANRIVAQVVWNFWNDNKPVDPALVYEELCKRKEDVIVGGHEGLMRLADAMPEASHAKHYSNIVRDKAILRNLITSCQEIISDAYEASEEVHSILDHSENRMYEVAHQSSAATAMEIGPVLRKVMKTLDERPHGKGVVTGLGTGYYELDELTSGLQESELVVLAARPSMGKTTLALNIAEHVALEEDAAVVVFSLETSVERIAHNMLCAHARIDAHKLRTGYLPAEEYSKLNMAVGVLSEAKILIDDTTMLTPFQLKAKARRLKAKVNIRMIIVDYLQLLDAPRAENRQQEISIISRQLKALAKELSVPVLAVSQLSRAVEAREGNRPRLSDLRESGAIEQDADVVMLMYRGDYYQPDRSRHTHEAEVIVAKQRNGPTGTVKLRFFNQFLRFENLARDEEIPQFDEERVAF